MYRYYINYMNIYFNNIITIDLVRRMCYNKHKLIHPTIMAAKGVTVCSRHSIMLSSGICPTADG